MKRKNGFLKKFFSFPLLFALIVCFSVGCAGGNESSSGSEPSSGSQTSDSDQSSNGSQSSDSSQSGGSEAQERRFSVQAKVTDAFQNPLNNVAVNVNGNSAAVSGQDGSFHITDLELDETNVLELSLDGFQTYSVDLSKYDNKKDQETDLGSIILLRNYAVVSSLENKTWQEYEAFSLSVTRDANSLLLKAESPNGVFEEEGRGSKLELYLSANKVAADRDENVCKITLDGTGEFTKSNYGNKNISSHTVTHAVKKTADGGTEIDFAVPFAMLNCNADAIVGVAMRMYSDKEDESADMMALDGAKTIDVRTPAEYIRTDKVNLCFACVQNVYPDDIKDPVDREALTEGYRLHISIPELNRKGDIADDIYVKSETESDGFLISMIGFNEFTESEYIKLVVHTSAVNGTGWKIQANDVSFLVGRTKAAYRTGLTAFWDYVNFNASTETRAANAPVYTEYEGYFTLQFKVAFAEIPDYSADKNVSLFAMEFENGDIYDGVNYLNGMLIDGLSSGDPADQSSYLPIQGFEEEIPDAELIKDYDIEFSIGADHIYARVERNATSLTLNMLSFHTFDDSDFVRMIVHTDPVDNAGWALSKSDVSFTIYKGAAYYQTGKIGFFENSENQFHGTDKTIHAPVYTENDGYWQLSIEIEYIEIGFDVGAETEMTALLMEYTPALANNGFKQNGTVQGDMADQKNYFVI